MPSEDIKFQMLTAHYKDTFDFLQNKLKQRDRQFVGVLCILIIMLFQLYTPQEALQIISQFISTKLNINTQINLLFIQSFIWFGLLATVLKYFQTVVFIERQYNYIRRLEEQISPEYSGKAFTREGISYLKNYPKYLSWASFLYTIFFPILLVLIIISKIFFEFLIYGFESKLCWFNGVISCFILISTILYVLVLHFSKE